MLLVAVASGFCLLLSVLMPATASFANFSCTFSEDGIYNGTQYNIVKIEIFNLSASNRDFANPGAGNFSAGSWTVQMPNIDWMLATNATPGGTQSFSWTDYLTGLQNGAVLELAYLAYTSTGEVYGTYINFNNGTWTYSTFSPVDINDPRFNRTITPVPPTVFLLGAGLIGMAVLRKRVHRQDNIP